MLVTKCQLPLLYEACDAISHDGGGRAGHKAYAIGDVLPHVAQSWERSLGTLTADERNDFAIGEDETMLEIASRGVELQAAHAQLLHWFNDGAPCGCSQVAT